MGEDRSAWEKYPAYFVWNGNKIWRKIVNNLCI